ncbi:MAG TPA: hypothetical protein VH120_19780 [Gemmataceae bacterium]|jgi:hypothetical protein|nr:hypothetical protein [Gemmataceae bacterium]
MPTEPISEGAPETPPAPVDAHAIRGMGWVMPVWLMAFLAVVVFGIISYLFGWWYQKAQVKTAQAPTSQTRMVS